MKRNFCLIIPIVAVFILSCDNSNSNKYLGFLPYGMQKIDEITQKYDRSINADADLQNTKEQFFKDIAKVEEINKKIETETKALSFPIEIPVKVDDVCPFTIENIKFVKIETSKNIGFSPNRFLYFEGEATLKKDTTCLYQGILTYCYFADKNGKPIEINTSGVLDRQGKFINRNKFNAKESFLLSINIKASAKLINFDHIVFTSKEGYNKALSEMKKVK